MKVNPQLEINNNAAQIRDSIFRLERKNVSDIDVTYKVGDVASEDGWYICVPCGTKKYFKAGMRFTDCLKCFGKQKRLFRKGLELWEKIFRRPKNKNQSI